MDEFSTELEEIKREIVESRALTIKTNNLVNALAADLKSIAKRQQGYERRFTIHSTTAYVVVVAVSLVIIKFAWDFRVEAMRSDNRQTRESVARLEKQVETLEAREEARTRTSRQATQFWELVEQNQRREIVKQHETVAKLPLTRVEKAVFARATAKAKNELSLIAYQDGLDHVRTGRWHEAAQAFRESLEYGQDAAHAPRAQYQLARSLRQLNRQREAIPILVRLSTASADKEVMDDATYLLAESQLDIGAWNDAKGTLRSFIRRFPNSPHIGDARLKLADVQLKH